MWIAVVSFCAYIDTASVCRSHALQRFWPDEETCEIMIGDFSMEILRQSHENGAEVYWFNGLCEDVDPGDKV